MSLDVACFYFWQDVEYSLKFMRDRKIQQNAIAAWHAACEHALEQNYPALFKAKLNDPAPSN